MEGIFVTGAVMSAMKSCQACHMSLTNLICQSCQFVLISVKS